MTTAPNGSDGPTLGGLTTAEVADRRAAGAVNHVPRPPSRTFLGILRANVITPFNAVLGALFVIVVVVAPAQDALFGIVIAANVLIGTVQEVRAKRTLDRLTILGAPTVRVFRDGAVVTVASDEVVIDDLVVVGPGDQLVVDALVVDAEGLELDESLVTGESEPCRRVAGDEVLSGSFVVAGSGRVRANRVGTAAFAADLTEQARRFAVTRSPLQADVTTILRVVAVAIVPAAALLVSGQVRAGLPARDAATRAVAGVVTMVPEGLLLLTSVAFAVGIVRLGARRCLVKELPAVELLARVTVVCVDKTGTLTAGDIELVGVEPLGTDDEAKVRDVLGALAAGDPNPNATMRAIAQACPAGGTWSDRVRVPFDSARKWSGATLVSPGGVLRTLVVGAPEFVTDDADTLARVAAVASDGHRVVLVATGASPLPGPAVEVVALPVDLRPYALVVLEERVRPDAADTIAYFGRQGVTLKVISGDNPATVAAIADRLGVPNARRSVDARTLPDDDPEAFAAVVDEATTFGRVTPHQKRAMVLALRRAGHVVAMTGDGVNDVLAMKEADLGIAMGQGSPATRAVASVVLLDNAFASLPAVVAEGRRVIANIERVAVLFLTKTVAALWLATATGIAGLPYPFLPRHLSLISATAIGTPAFVLALAPADGPARGSFVRRAALRATITGTGAALGAGGAFAVVLGPLGRDLVQAQTAATAALAAVMLVVLASVARPLTWRRAFLVGAMAAIATAAFAVGPVRRFLDLVALDGAAVTATVAAVVAGVVTVSVGNKVLVRRTARHGVRELPRSDEVRRSD